MAAITEDFVPFETAKLLKEKGFDELCAFQYYTYWEDGKLKNYLHPIHLDTMVSNSQVIGRDNVTAPTLQMAMKWLREVHNLFLAVGFGADAKGEFLYMADIYNLRNDAIDGIYKPIVEADDYLLNNPKSYEEACEAAIKYCLENLI